MNKKELLKIIDQEEDSFNWGGDEDENGSLNYGYVDWEKIKKAIKEFAISKDELKKYPKNPCGIWTEENAGMYCGTFVGKKQFICSSCKEFAKSKDDEVKEE